MRPEVAVLLYPGCVFFEVALATETLARAVAVLYYTPDGRAHTASNAAVVSSSGSYEALAKTTPLAVLIPGGDPASILLPDNLAVDALQSVAKRGALLAGICAGNLVLAASGLLRGRQGTHNYTLEHMAAEGVQATAHYWHGMAFRRENLVQDGRIITAQPWAYRQYAATVARALGLLSTSEARELEEYVARRSYGDARVSDEPRGAAPARGLAQTSGVMRIRAGNPGDAKAVASLIASFQPILTLDPGGAGAEQYLASVSENAERQYLESPRYAYLVAELEGQVAGFVAIRDGTHLFHLFVAAAHQRVGIARALWEQARLLSQQAGPIAQFTVNSSLNAVPVYRSFGFVPAGALVQVHGIAFLPMRLTLQNDA